MKFLSLIAASGFVSSVAAHGGVLSYKTVNPKAYLQGFKPYNSPSGQSSVQREWDSFSPLLDPTAKTLVCNAAGTPGALQAPIAAGSEITAYWNTWSHLIGPVIVWMASCGASCLNFQPTGAIWFKIDEVGLISGTVGKGKWGQGQLAAANSSWTVTIPATLAPGAYLLRHELIALHSSNQPQWYPECAQMIVTGSGTAVPGASYKASIPGVYNMQQPSININIYANNMQSVTNYTIPGPPVWTG